MVGKREINTRSYVGSFNFKGGDQQKKVGLLSGGERNRVHLAKTLAEAGNLILLDEPTNDLDIETLQALEEALELFAGCAVVISHDRWFWTDGHTPRLRGRGPRRVVRATRSLEGTRSAASASNRSFRTAEVTESRPGLRSGTGAALARIQRKVIRTMPPADGDHAGRRTERRREGTSDTRGRESASCASKVERRQHGGPAIASHHLGQAQVVEGTISSPVGAGQ